MESIEMRSIMANLEDLINTGELNFEGIDASFFLLGLLSAFDNFKGCGILKRNFYTRFIPIFKDFGAVTWSRKE